MYLNVIEHLLRLIREVLGYHLIFSHFQKKSGPVIGQPAFGIRNPFIKVIG